MGHKIVCASFKENRVFNKKFITEELLGRIDGYEKKYDITYSEKELLFELMYSDEAFSYNKERVEKISDILTKERFDHTVHEVSSRMAKVS